MKMAIRSFSGFSSSAVQRFYFHVRVYWNYQLKRNEHGGVMELEALIQARRDQILALAARYGASNVRIFGSVARGEARPDSDIDLLVDLEPGRTLLDLGGLLMDLRDLLQVLVDIGTEAMLKDRIRERVAREAVPL